ncbi:MAG TPA: hypothetical protein VFU31_00425 [Candidatus Binatia bacterium]|nr:hypothetical protein [Candidatus Binatia bacterium]
MAEFVLRLLVLLRFVCFVAVVYLTLHVIFSRLISKSDSKVLWFFSVLTVPLTRPVRAWFVPNASESQLLFAAMLLYGLLWMLVLIGTEMMAVALR